MLIAELCRLYQSWADGFYRKHGHPTESVRAIKTSLRELTNIYGRDKLETFGPKRLTQVQMAMVSRGLKPRTINMRITWIRAMFDWAAKMELVDELLPMRLSRVRHLRLDSRTARPVEWEDIAATLAHLPLKFATMVELQLAAGMRPNEVCIMCLSQIDMAGDVWVYTPLEHKTEHFGLSRTVLLDATAQHLIATWRRHMRPGVDWLFEGGRGGRPNNRPISRPAYYKAIWDANHEHQLKHWKPMDLRRKAITDIWYNSREGPVIAQQIAGHRKLMTTEIYVGARPQHAIEALRRRGLSST